MEIEVDAIKEYSTFYRDFVRCVSNWPVLKPLWDYIMEGNYILRSPRKIVSIMDSFRVDLTYEMNAVKIDAEILNKNELIKAAEFLGDANLTDLETKLSEYANYISKETVKLRMIRNDITLHTNYRRDLIEASRLGDKVRELIQYVHNATGDMVEMMRRETISHCIKQLQSSLAIKENTLTTIDIQKGIIDSLKKQIEILIVEEEASKVLVKQLSPTEGLIGDGLLGFIKLFINQMNIMIRKVWSYPIKVLDCSSGDGELDFKFKVIINNNPEPVPDIRGASEGQREIINLAFRLTAAKYLGLADSPLFLDEYSGSFDQHHKVAAMEAIKSLMETKSFTQLFIVSHDYMQYGSLHNSEVCVIDEKNITVPEKYNQHVSIK